MLNPQKEIARLKCNIKEENKIISKLTVCLVCYENPKTSLKITVWINKRMKYGSTAIGN